MDIAKELTINLMNKAIRMYGPSTNLNDITIMACGIVFNAKKNLLESSILANVRPWIRTTNLTKRPLIP